VACLPRQFHFSALSAKVVRLNKVELDEVLAATVVGELWGVVQRIS